MPGASPFLADVLLLLAGVEALTLRQYAPDAALDEPGAYVGSGKAGADTKRPMSASGTNRTFSCPWP
jgi:hypothetical protein